MGKITLRKAFKKAPAKVLNFLLLFSLIVPNVLSPAIVIAQELDIEQTEIVEEIPIDESEDILEEGISTSIFEEGVYTVSLVEEKEYVYPDDDRVRIRFTSITEEGNLVIQKVVLTEEEKTELNTTEEYGWNFTSTMSNGSFTYDLVLPNEQGEEIEVKYTEDGNTYSSVEQPLINEDIVKILGLDHFTTFVVVPSGTIPIGVDEGTTEVDGTCNIGTGAYCYDSIQEAINAAQANGDTDQDIINIQNGTYNECLNITGKNITLLGQSRDNVIIDNSACSSYGIHVHEADQIVFKNMTVKGAPNSYTFKIANSTNIELRKVIVNDSYRTAIDLNGVNNAFLNNIVAKNTTWGFGLMIKDSNNIEVGNVKTENNMWGGVSVQTEGYPYPAGSDNVRFTGTFNAKELIPLLIEEDPHRNTGIYTEITNLQVPSQFQYIIYTLREDDEYKQWFYNETLEVSKVFAQSLISSSSPSYTDILLFDVTKENYWTIPGMLIQDAIVDATDNDVINITEGTYEEQLSVDSKNLTLQGDGRDKTFINSPDTLETLYVTSANNKPIVYFHNSVSIIKDLTVDGLGKGNANNRMIGISFYNAGGRGENLEIMNIKDTPPSGVQNGVGIYAYNLDTVPRTLDLNSVIVHDYQKNGITLIGEGLTANIYDSLIYGFGDIDFIAQNGVQYTDGATGIIQNNEIYGNLYTPDDWAATGILPYNAGEGLKILNNDIHNNGWGGIYAIGVGPNLEIINNNLHNNIGEAIILFGGDFENALVKGNTVENNDYGIWLDPGISDTVKITENIFNNTYANAADDGAYYYDNGVKGNYWSDYTGFDLNGDGIGETPYDIDEDSSDRYPLTTQHLSATVNSVNAHKDYYKEGDVLSIDVEVTNNGSIALDPTKEQLVINITNPEGAYISGTFRGKALLDLQPGETRIYEFYTSEQIVPNTWEDGTYRIHSSIYSQRTSPLNYLVGGQNNSETFIVDSTKPSTPTLISPEDNYFTNQISVIQTWTSTNTDIDYYEYESCSNDPDVDGFCTGIYSITTENTSRTVNNNNITFWWRVRAIDFAGNIGYWSEARSITIDTINPIMTSYGLSDSLLNSSNTNIVLTGDITDERSPIEAVKFAIWNSNKSIVYRNWTNTNATDGAYDSLNESTNEDIDITSLPEGDYVLGVRGWDMAGNKANGGDFYFSIDRTGPEILFGGLRYINSTTIDTLDINTNDSTPIIIFTASDTLGTVTEASVNGFSATYDGTYWVAEITSPLPEGINSLSIKTQDNAGNESEITHNIFVDTKAPTAQYKYFKNGEEIFSNTAYVQEVSQLSFLGQYMDDDPSSGILKDSYVIFDSNLLGTARTSKSYCGWRGSENTVMIPYTEKVLFTNCEPTLPDGQYFMYHQVYDNAVRKDIPTITQFRDVKGLHFIVDKTFPTIQSLDDFTINEGSTIPTKQILVEDNYEIEELCYSITSDIGDVSETCISPSTSKDSWNVDLTDTILTELSTTYGITTTVADTSIIPEGDYTISYFAKDKAGNSSSIEEVIVTIVNVEPTVLFSSSTTEILAGNSISFNGSFIDPGLDDSNWTYTLSFGDGTPDVLGTLPAQGNILTNYLHTYTTAGDYIASLEVCEDGGVICTTETIDISVGAVQGVTSESSTTTTNSPTLAKKVTTFFADILGVGGEGDALALENEEEILNEDTEEVKGSQTCDNPSTISGYIYIDSNNDGIKDEGERVFSEISIRVYTITDGMEETVKQLITDENGYWETTLCSGQYFVKVDDSKLPNNFVLGENDQEIQIVEEEDTSLDFTVLDERNFLQKYWPWILLAVGILGSIGIVALDTRRKKEYI